jgi:hypothetical protein
LKKEGIEGVKKKEKEVTIKLSLVETGMTKKLKTRQLLQSKLDNFVINEGKLRSLMESKRNDFLEVEKTKKAVNAENLSIKKENEVLSVDKMKLLDTAAALKDELEVKISHLLGMDRQVAKEMEITRRLRLNLKKSRKMF